ncbi:DUF881 domain-containing protein [Kineosporiaceae bacterium SCSIO 59966]|nr:DUF881 domain-containing protein [Kineosporiaceae bacterium SCSIO 59966]
MSTPTRRRDDSMSLLTEVMENPLDPGYALAAQDRREGRVPPTRGRRLVLWTLAAVVTGTLLGAAVLDLRRPEPGDARTILLEEISARSEHADDTRERVDALRAEVEALQAEALQGEPEVLELARRLSQDAGVVPVTGPGLVVTLDDASRVRDPLAEDPRESDAEDDRVVDADVQVTVNGLWEAGAEAIAVNDQRLTSLSAIRSAGGAVLVGFRPLQPPYRVQAIGDPAALRTGLAESSAASYLAFVQDRYGLRVSVQTEDHLELPGTGTLRLRYAEVPDGASARGSGETMDPTEVSS